jgi:hypothetical protein
MPSEPGVPRRAPPGTAPVGPEGPVVNWKAAAVGIILLVAFGAGLGGWLLGSGGAGIFGDGDGQDTTVVILPTTTPLSGTTAPSPTATPYGTATAGATPMLTQTAKPSPSAATAQPTPTTPAVVQVSVDDDPSWGSGDAPVTIIEFGDYQ